MIGIGVNLLTGLKTINALRVFELSEYQAELASLLGVQNPSTASGTVAVRFSSNSLKTQLSNKI